MTAVDVKQPAGVSPTDPVRRPRARRLLDRRHIRPAIITLLLLPVCLVWIYPFLWMVSASLKTDLEIFGSVGLIPSDPQWANYQRAWWTAGIRSYFWNTVFITIATIAIVVITTAMIGYVLGRYSFPGKRVVIGAFIATVFLPEGYTIIPVFEVVDGLGLSNTLWGVILAESGGAHVIIILLFAGYFRQLPKELEEAARVDGAGFVRTFWTVMLPLAKPAIATGVILTLMKTWNSFLIPLVLTLARPEQRTLAVGIYSLQGEDLTDWSGMAAASTLSIMPIVIIFLLLQRYFVEGLTGAVRG